MGSITAWQPAQPGSARCFSRAARKLRCVFPLVVASRRGTSGGGGGGGAPRRFPKTHFPRCTTDVRFGGDVTVNKLACPSNPPRCASSGDEPSDTRRNCDP